jgi:hypothetical protein
VEADANRGCAAFVIRKGGELNGVPLKIAIPQYAVHVDEATGKETKVIIIQAEESSGIQAVCYKVVGSQDIGAALLKEMRLLGTKKPK